MDLSDLRKRLSGRRIFHAYIVTGGTGEKRLRAGELIARAAVCSGAGPAPCGVCRDCVKALRGVHPDIETVRSQRKDRELTVDSMREVRSRAAVVPNEADRSVYIIADADLMNLQAQNAMLKIFEEPPGHAVFVLLAENPLKLIPTVRSRCETVTLPPEPEEEPGCRRLAEEIIKAYTSRDSLELTRALSPVEKLDRTEVSELIPALRAIAVRAVPEKDLPDFSDTLDEAELMARANVNAGHIAGLLLGRLCDTRKR